MHRIEKNEARANDRGVRAQTQQAAHAVEHGHGKGAKNGGGCARGKGNSGGRKPFARDIKVRKIDVEIEEAREKGECKLAKTGLTSKKYSPLIVQRMNLR